jgi:alpha-glucosidase
MAAGLFHLTLVLGRSPLVFLAAVAAGRLLFACTQSAQAAPSQSAFLVGDGIAEFVPPGYDRARTPSLALASEPEWIGEAPAGFKLHPVFVAGPGKFYSAQVDAPAGTSFYGTGEVAGPLLRNNTAIKLWNTDNFNWTRDGGSRLYQSDPWVLGVRPDGSAFGVLFDTTWKSQLKCGDHNIEFDSMGPAFRVFVIDRATPQAVLRGLAELTGTIPLPPRWAVGFHQCRYSYYPDARVREIADGFRSRHIPCDVIWMDIDYMNGFRIFTFDPKRFPDPGATNQYLHDHGFKSIWMIDPGVKAEKGYAVYESGSAANAWVRAADGSEYHGSVWPGVCAFPDFTSPAARAWWGGLYKGFLARGVDGVWNDMNEPSVFGGPDGTMPESNRHAGGGGLPPGPHLEYAATWTGDNGAAWPFLKESIPMSLNLGLSGQPFSGPDIGGYSGRTAPEVFGNWMGLGAFYPFSRAHKAKGEPNSEPWTFGPEVEAASRTALERRYRLLPYIYTLFEEASRTGLPVMRPVFMADRTDLALRGEQQAFTLGDDLLVIPRWATDVHLPKGDWRAIDIIDPKLEADPYQPVLKIRPGAIVPLGRIIENTTQESLDPLTLLVSLDAAGHAEGWLYEDDGDGFGYKTGDYALIRYVADKSGNEVIVRIKDRTGARNAAHHSVKVEVVIGDHGMVTAEGDDVAGIHCALN